MPWVKLDDQFLNNTKTRAAGVQGRALYIAGLLYCAQLLTDGRIPAKDLPLVAASAEVPVRHAKVLVEFGLWERDPSGYVVHDYLTYNPSAEQVRAERLAAAERMRRHRDRKNGVSDAVTNGVGSASPSPSLNVPKEHSRRPLRIAEPQGPTYRTFDPDEPQCIPCEGQGRNIDTGGRCTTCGGTGKPAEVQRAR